MANVVKYILDVDSRKTKKGLDSASRSVDKFSGKTKRARSSGLQMAASIGAAVAGLQAGLSLATGAISTFTDSITRAAEASFDLTKSVVDSVNQLNDLSTRSGLTAESIQAVIQAFEGSGQSAQRAESFISKLPKIYNDIARETTAAGKTAKELGLSVKDSNGEFKSADQVLKETISLLQSIEDDTQRSTIAFNILGRSAGDLLQAFGETANFEKFLAFTEEFGVKATPKASAEAARFQQLLSAIGIAAGGLKQKFVNALGGVSFFNDALKQSLVIIVSLQELITNSTDEFNLFGETLKTIGTGTIQFFTDILIFLSQFFQETASQLDRSLSPTLIILEKTGVISTKTFLELTKGLKLATQSAGALEEKLQGFLRPSGAQTLAGAAAGGTAATRVDTNIEEILEGIKKQVDKTVPSLNNFEDAIGAVGNKVKDEFPEFKPSRVETVDSSILGAPVFDPENLQETIISMNNLINQFSDPLEQQLARTRESIRSLEAGLEVYSEVGLDTMQIQSALNKARNEEVDLMNQQVSTSQKLIDKISESVQGFETFINAISSPENLVNSFEPFLENLGEKLNKFGEKFGSQFASKLGTVITAVAPIAGAVGGAVLAIEKLGQTTEEDLKKNFDGFIKNFVAGVDLIPELLSEILPNFIAELTVAMIGAVGELAITIPTAIISAIPELIRSLVSAFRDLLSESFENLKSLFSSAGEIAGAFVGGDRETRKEKRKELRERILGFESGGQVGESGIRFTGSGEGLAVLHKNEFVVNAAGRTSQAAAQTLDQNQGVTLNVYADIVEGSAVDELMRKIEQRFGSFGASTSNLFGGA